MVPILCAGEAWSESAAGAEGDEPYDGGLYLGWADLVENLDEFWGGHLWGERMPGVWGARYRLACMGLHGLRDSECRLDERENDSRIATVRYVPCCVVSSRHAKSTLRSGIISVVRNFPQHPCPAPDPSSPLSHGHCQHLHLAAPIAKSSLDSSEAILPQTTPMTVSTPPELPIPSLDYSYRCWRTYCWG